MNKPLLILPRCYPSRFYSLVKRLAWGLFFNALISLCLQCVASNNRQNLFGDEKKLGVLFLVLLAVVPVLLVLWALLRPRLYAEKRSYWTLLLFLPLFAVDYFLTVCAIVFAYWMVWPPQFAR